jgi:uncharacterized RmlC-like cupin family protein
MSDLTCIVADGDGMYSGAQGFDYFEGISAQTVGARRDAPRAGARGRR